MRHEALDIIEPKMLLKDSTQVFVVLRLRGAAAARFCGCAVLGLHCAKMLLKNLVLAS